MLRIAVLCSGGGTNLQALLDAGLDAKIALVIASRPDAYALVRAASRGIPAVCEPKKLYKTPGAYEDRLISLINDFDIDLIVLAGFMIILDNRFTQAFEGRIINIHPSLIPDFCGKGFYGIKVHEAVLEAGVNITGATVHYVTEAVDGGPVILQKTVAVREGDTPLTLQKRVMEEAERIILPQAVRLVCGELTKRSKDNI
ncbi:MAG: phosphoribosylglycinamide formyltransferase [Clostridiales bacterium]|jgi:phosphoribosylglycinamide formyltransferase-1|nr:phosphoribosylglycinamide formyltransferase [Clostridiales bacterium]